MNGFYFSFCDAAMAGIATMAVIKPFEHTATKGYNLHWMPDNNKSGKFMDIMRDTMKTDGVRSFYYRFGRESIKYAGRQGFMFGLNQKYRQVFLRQDKSFP